MAAVEIAMAATPPPSYDTLAIIQTFYAERERAITALSKKIGKLSLII